MPTFDCGPEWNSGCMLRPRHLTIVDPDCAMLGIAVMSYYCTSWYANCDTLAASQNHARSEFQEYGFTKTIKWCLNLRAPLVNRRKRPLFDHVIRSAIDIVSRAAKWSTIPGHLSGYSQMQGKTSIARELTVNWTLVAVAGI